MAAVHLTGIVASAIPKMRPVRVARILMPSAIELRAWVATARPGTRSASRTGAEDLPTATVVLPAAKARRTGRRASATARTVVHDERLRHRPPGYPRASRDGDGGDDLLGRLHPYVIAERVPGKVVVRAQRRRKQVRRRLPSRPSQCCVPASGSIDRILDLDGIVGRLTGSSVERVAQRNLAPALGANGCVLIDE
jgi:hypothetical protein